MQAAPVQAATAPAFEPVPAPQPQPQPKAEPAIKVVPDLEPDGPHVRLGALWALITFIVTATVVSLALWFAIVAAVAALQACRTWRNRPREPVLPLAAAGAAVLPLAAVLGPIGFAVAAAAVGIASLAYRPDPKRSAPALTALVAFGLGAAAAAPVLVRRGGLVEVIVLLTLVGVYDASAFLVGSGATRRWEGPVAGIAFMFAVTLAAAAVFVPPFEGVSPWLLGALAAGLAPFGPDAAERLLGDTKARVPAVRRLDSLLLVGPAWTLAAYALL